MSPEAALRFHVWFNNRAGGVAEPYSCDLQGRIWYTMTEIPVLAPRSIQVRFEEEFYAFQEAKGFQTSLDSEPETSILNLMDVVLKACAANKSTAKLCLKKFTQWLDSTKF